MKKLHFEKEIFENEIQKKQAYVDKVNEFGEVLNSEGIALKADILEDFCNGGKPYMEELLVDETIKKFNSKELQVNSIMLEGFKRDAATVANKFSPFQAPMISAASKAASDPYQLTYKNGKVSLSEKVKQELEEDLTLMLRDEDKKLHARLEKLAEFLNTETELLQAEKAGSLQRHLELALTENRTWTHPRFGPVLRDDMLFIRNGSKFEVNPAWFDARKESK